MTQAGATMTMQTVEDEMLRKLSIDSFGLLDKIVEQDKSKELLEKVKDANTKLEDAIARRDEASRQAHERILNVTISELRDLEEEKKQDLAFAMTGLHLLMTKIGQGYDALDQPTKEELRLVSDAEFDLKEAENALEAARQSWWAKSRRIAAAQNGITRAKANIVNAQNQAKEMKRQRLMNADVETSLQLMVTKTLKVIGIMEEGCKVTAARLKEISEQLVRDYKIKQEAAKRLEECEKQISDAENAVKIAENELVGLVNGTEAHVAKEAQITALRGKVSELSGKRDIYLALHMSKDRFVKQHEVHQNSQRQLLNQSLIWITTLKSDTDGREVLFRSQLSAMKRASDQEVASQMDDLGVKLDISGTRTMAMVGAAASRLTTEMFETHPNRIFELNAAANSQAEATAEIKQRMEKVIEGFQLNYGISVDKDAMYKNVG